MKTNQKDSSSEVKIFCNVCKSDNTKFIFEKDGIKFRKCKKCTLVFVYPLPTIKQQKEYYDSHYKKGDYKLYSESQSLREKLNEKRFDDLKNFVSQGKLLDIGCATGYFLDVAHKNGFEVFGVEISEEACEKTKKKFPNIFNGTLEDANFQSSTFDLVTIFDLIEHVLNAEQTIKEINRVMTKNAIAVFTTPDISSWHAKIMGKHWYQINPLQHLYYFSPKTFTKLLEENGFKILKIEKNLKIFRIDDIIKMMEFYFPTLYKIVNSLKQVFPKKFLLKDRLFYFGEIHVITQKK